MIDLGHLPPGTPALLLIMGGLGLSIPVSLAMLLAPSPRAAAQVAPRSVLAAIRAPGASALDASDLTRIDQAIERVYRAGLGDARIVHANATRKILRFEDCACTRGGTCERTRESLERAVAEALGRHPHVRELHCEPRGCEFAVSY